MGQRESRAGFSASRTDQQASVGWRPALGKGERLWEATWLLGVSFQARIWLENEPVQSGLHA